MPGFPKLLRFQEHHDRILKKLLSRLFKNLVSFLSDWLFCDHPTGMILCCRKKPIRGEKTRPPATTVNRTDML